MQNDRAILVPYRLAWLDKGQGRAAGRECSAMKLGNLSVLAQNGLTRWAKDVHDDELMLEAISSLPENWAWVWFQLRYAIDKPEWFPCGKWATLQRIESFLNEEVARSLSERKEDQKP